MKVSPDSTGDSFCITLCRSRRLCAASISFEIGPEVGKNGWYSFLVSQIRMSGEVNDSLTEVVVPFGVHRQQPTLPVCCCEAFFARWLQAYPTGR
jgi:hypothetical protein